MESGRNNVIPTDLVGKWGYNVGNKLVDYIRINADGSGNFSTLNDGKWSVNENRLEFRRVKNYDCPLSGSAQYSIINEKLFFSEPLEGDFSNEFSNLMFPYLQNGLEKIK